MIKNKYYSSSHFQKLQEFYAQRKLFHLFLIICFISILSIWFVKLVTTMINWWHYFTDLQELVLNLLRFKQLVRMNIRSSHLTLKTLKSLSVTSWMAWALVRVTLLLCRRTVQMVCKEILIQKNFCWNCTIAFHILIEHKMKNFIFVGNNPHHLQCGLWRRAVS